MRRCTNPITLRVSRTIGLIPLGHRERAVMYAAGGTLEIVIDETLERCWGAKIRKRGHYRDRTLESRAVGEQSTLALDSVGGGRAIAVDEAALSPSSSV